MVMQSDLEFIAQNMCDVHFAETNTASKWPKCEIIITYFIFIQLMHN
jgi:hypothetical protein